MRQIITLMRVRAYIEYLKKKGINESVVKTKLSSISVFVKWASDKGLIEKKELWQIEKEIANFTAIKVIKDRPGGSNIKSSLLSRQTPFSYLIGGAFMLIFMAVLGAGVYNQFFKDVKTPFAYPTSLTRGTRTLSFQGRLTDNLRNPITAATNMVFRLYNNSSSTAPQYLLYSSGTCSVTPDQDGIFNSLIGQDCGAEIGSSVFTENQNVYLDVQIGSESLSPRQQIANVGYAMNAETLQGFPASIGAVGSTVPFIPYVDSSGLFAINSDRASISLGSGTGPHQITTGGTSALALMSGGNVGIGTTSPSEKIDIAGTGSNLTFSGTTTAHQITTGGTSDLSLNPGGNVGVGMTNPTYKLDVLGSVHVSSNGLFESKVGIGYTNPASRLTVAGGAAIGTTNSSSLFLSTIAPSGGLIVEGNVGIGNTGSSFKLDVSGNTNIGGTISVGGFRLGTSTSAGYILTADTNGYGTWQAAATTVSGNGAANYLARWINSTQISTGVSYDNGTFLGVGYAAAVSGALLVNGNVGIGTTNPQAALDVRSSLSVGTPLAGISGVYNFVVNGPDAGIYQRRSGTVEPFIYLSTDTAGSGGQIRGLNAGGLRFTDPASTTEWARIDTNGNVGIGTASPTSKISIAGNQSIGVSYTGVSAPANGLIVAGNVGIGSTGRSGITLDVAGQVRVGATGTTTTANLCIDSSGVLSACSASSSLTGTGSNNYLARWLSATQLSTGISYDNGTFLGVGYTAAVSGSFLVNGNVGIGTTNPTDKIEINGNVTSGGGLTITTPGTTKYRIGTLGTAIPDWGGQFINMKYNEGAGNWTADDDTKVSGFFKLDVRNATYGNEIAFYRQPIAANPRTDASIVPIAQFKLDTGNIWLAQTSGSVGIGTSAPNAKLQVVGTTNLQGTTISQLSVTGVSSLAGTTATQFYSSGAISGGSSLTIVGNSNLAGTTATQLYVTGATNLNTLGVSGLSTLAGVTASQFYSTGAISGGSTLNITGLSTLAGATASQFYSTGAIAGGSTLNIVGVSNLAGTTVSQFYNSGVSGFAGNVGIGTSSPVATYKLYVAGAIYGTTITQNGNLVCDSSGLNCPVNNLTGGATNYLARWISATQLSTGISYDNGTFLGVGYNAAVSGALLINGNVGIGTTNPGAKLDVTGDVIVSTAGTTKGRIRQSDGRLSAGPGGIGITRSDGAGVSDGATITFDTNNNLAFSPSSLAIPQGTVIGSVSGNQNDTRITFGSSGYLAFITGGLTNERVRIDSSGNVGIGTTNPRAPFELASALTGYTGATLYGARFNPSISGTISNTQPIVGLYGIYNVPSVTLAGTAPHVNNLYVGYNGFSIGTGTTITNYFGQYIAAPSGSTASQVVNKYALVTEPGAGNVGLGTTAPFSGVRLDVAGQVRVGTTGATTANNLCIDVNGILSACNSSSSLTGTGQTNYLARWISATQLSTGVSYDNGTAVGIGTTNPVALLSVGVGQTSGFFVFANGNVGIGTTGPGAKLHLYSSGDLGQIIQSTGGAATLTLDRATTGNSAAVFMKTGGAYRSRFGLSYAGSTDDFFISRFTGSAGSETESEVLRIQNSTGNVGIGTTNPLFKLDVNGTISGTGVTTNTLTATGLSTLSGVTASQFHSTGAISGGSTLTITGNSNLAGTTTSQFYTSGRLTAAGVSNLAGTTISQLSVTGISSLAGTTATQFHSTGAISGATTLNITGLSTLAGATASQFYSTGAIAGGSSLTIVGNTNLAGTTVSQFYNSGVSAFAGNVGIGTSSPVATYKLYVVGAIYGTTITQNGNTVCDSSGLNCPVNNLTGGATNYLARWISATQLSTGISYDNGTFLGVGYAAGTGGALLVNGNVGIGTTAPGAKLHVSDGNALAAALVTTDTQVISSQTSNPSIGLVAALGSGSGDRAVFKGTWARGTLASPTVPSSGDSVLSFLGAIYDGVDTEGTAMVNFVVDGAVSSNVAPQRIGFFTSETNGASRLERLTIKSNGNVGIGTTNPNATLQVIGTTNLQGTTISQLSVTGISSLAGTTATQFHATGAISGGSTLTIVGNSNLAGTTASQFYTSGKLTAAGVSNLAGTTISQLSVTGISSLAGTTATQFHSTGAISGGSTLNITGLSTLAGATASQFYSTGAIAGGSTLNIIGNTNLAGTTVSQFYNSGTSAFAGNVGVGTSSPVATYKLYVAGAIYGTTITQNGNLVCDSSGLNCPANNLTGGATNYLARWISATQISTGVSYDNGTAVGVGTTAPGTLNGVSFSTVKLHTSNAATSNYVAVNTDLAGGYAGIIFNRSAANANNRMFVIDSQPAETNTSSQLSFSSYSDAGAPTPLLTMLRSGNVGIGTTAPTTLLSLGSSIGANTVKLALYDGGASDLYGFGIRAGYLDIYSSGAASGGPKMVIGSTGNVGIGTTNPLFKLDVNGTISGTGVTTNTLTATGLSTLSGVTATQFHSTGAISGGSTLTITGNSNLAGTTTSQFYSSGAIAGGSSLTIVGNSNLAGTTASQFYSTGAISGATTLNIVGISNLAGTTVSQFYNSGVSGFSGNVGIGTSSPVATYKLYVAGAIYGTTITQNGNLVCDSSGLNCPANNLTGGATNYLARWISATQLSTGISYDNGSFLGVGYTAAVSGALLVNGNVGIGTTNPGGKIAITGNITAIQTGVSYGVKIDPTLTGTLTSGQTSFYSIYNVPTVNIGGTSPNLSNFFGQYIGANVGVGVTSTLTNFYGLYVAAPNTSPSGTVTNRFAFVSEPNAGNVGIGTTNPNATLQVIGITNLQGTTISQLSVTGISSLAGTTATQFHATGAISGTSTLNITGLSTLAGATASQFYSTGAIAGGSSLTIVGNSNLAGTTISQLYVTGISSLAGTTATQFHSTGAISGATTLNIVGNSNLAGTTVSQFYNSGVSGFSGNVGIGTSSPVATYKLYVAGAIYGTTITQNGNLVCDSSGLNCPANNLTGGATNYLARWISATQLSTGVSYDNGSFLGVGTTASGSRLVVSGGIGIGTTNQSSTYLSTSAPSGGAIIEGNVGIGTTLPIAKLQVVGITNLQGTTISQLSVTGISNLAGTTVTQFHSTGAISGATTLNIVGLSTLAGTTATQFHSTGAISGATTLNIVGLSTLAGTTVSQFYSTGAIAGGSTLTIVGNTNLAGTTVSQFYNSGVSAFSGNVGIGTSSPVATYKLYVAGAIYGTTITQNGNTVCDSSGANCPANNLTGGATNYLARWISATQLSTGISYDNGSFVGIGYTAGTGGVLLVNGNVGIGTTSPGSKLTVLGDGAPGGVSTGPGVFSMNATGTGGYVWASEALAPNLTSGQIVINPMMGTAKSTSNMGWMGFKYDSSGSSNNALVWGFYGGASPYMTLLASGNVGIGTTNPNATLQVIGTTNLQGTTISQLSVTGISSLAGTTATQFHSTGAISGGSTLNITGLSTLAGATASQFYSTGAIAGGSTLTIVGNSNLAGTTVSQFYNSGVSGFSGNVGIGTSSPVATYKLYVAGAIYGTTITQNGNLVCDSSGLNCPTNNLTGGATNYLARWISATQISTGVSYDNGSFLGVGTTASGSRLVVSGGIGIGTTNQSSTYLSTSAPSGGAIIEGNVGIGTTLPNAKLQVVGITNLQGTTASQFYSTGAITGATTLNIVGLSTLAGTTATQFYSTGAISGATTLNIVGLSTLAGTTASQFYSTGAIAGGSTLTIVGNSNLAGTTVSQFYNSGVSGFSGNVGIGTSSPVATYKLYVAGAIYGTTITQNGNLVCDSSGLNCPANNLTGGATNYLARWISSTQLSTGISYDNGSFVGIGYTAGTGGVLFVNGNVGIGTTAPTYKLDVVGSSGEIGMQVGTTTNKFRFLYEATGGIGVIDSYYSSAHHTFRVGPDTYFDPAGNVGIGTSAPGFELDVNGTISGTGFTGSTLTLTGLANIAGVTASQFYTSGKLTAAGVSNLAGTTISQLSVTGISSLAGTTASQFYTSGKLTAAGVSNLAGTTISQLSVTGIASFATGITAPNVLYTLNANGPLAISGNPPADQNPTISCPTCTYGVNTNAGKSNFLARWTDSLELSTGISYDNGLFLGIGYTVAIGSPKLIINGNVGIGTSSPGGLLDVRNGSNQILYASTDGNVGIGTTDPTNSAGSGNFRTLDMQGAWGSNLRLGARASTQWDIWNRYTYFYIDQDGTNRLTIDPSGDVGIGTTFPASKLTIAGNQSIGVAYTGVAAPTNGLIVQGNVAIGTDSPLANFDLRVPLYRFGVGVNALTGTPPLASDTSDLFAGIATTFGANTDFRFHVEDDANDRISFWGNSCGGGACNNLNSSTNIMTLVGNGNVGLGHTNPGYMFSAWGSSSVVTAPLYAFTNRGTGNSIAVVKVSVGSALNSNARLISFYAGAAVDTGGSGVGNIRLGATGVQYMTTSADFGEYFTKGQNDLATGDVVALDSQGRVIRAVSGQTPIGVISDNAGFVGNGGGDEDDPNKIIVGLLGQVGTKIDPASDPIRPGDALTPSTRAGYVKKATTFGPTVGTAIEAWNPSMSMKRINIYVRGSWYDPDLYLASTGDLQTISNTAQFVYSGNIGNDTNGINSSLYTLINASGQTINRIGSFSEVVAAKVKTGYLSAENALIKNTLVAKNITSEQISAISGRFDRLIINQKIQTPVAEIDNLTTNEIQPKEQDVVVNLNPSTDNRQPTTDNGRLAALIIKGLEGKTVASIDSAGNATFSGTLTAQSVESRQLTVDEASISGRLVAKEIQSDNINSIQSSVISSQEDINKLATDNQQLTTNINEVQTLLADLKNQPIADPQYYQSLPNDIPLLSTSSATLASLTTDSLTVSGQSNLYNLTVSNSAMVGTLLMQDNTLLSLSSELKLSALNSINIFDGQVTIAKNGTITTNGSVIAKGGLQTNEIKPLNETDNVTVKLGTTITDGVVSNSKFQISNSLNEKIASIDASGSAYFKDGIAFDKYLTATSSASIASAADTFAANGIYSPSIKTESQTAGIGLMPTGSPEILIYNEKVTDESLIYVTATSPTLGKSLYLAQKQPCQQSTINSLPAGQAGPPSTCKPYFKVAIDGPTTSDIHFNWWIVN